MRAEKQKCADDDVAESFVNVDASWRRKLDDDERNCVLSCVVKLGESTDAENCAGRGRKSGKGCGSGRKRNGAGEGRRGGSLEDVDVVGGNIAREDGVCADLILVITEDAVC